MNNLINAVTVGVTTFAATNIDDIVILMLFFSQVSVAFVLVILLLVNI